MPTPNLIGCIKEFRQTHACLADPLMARGSCSVASADFVDLMVEAKLAS